MLQDGIDMNENDANLDYFENLNVDEIRKRESSKSMDSIDNVVFKLLLLKIY